MEKKVISQEFLHGPFTQAVFAHLDRLLPEFDFKAKGNGWQSTKKLDLTGAANSRRDKVVVTKKIPFMALEQGGENISLIALFRRLHSCGFTDAVKQMSERAGLVLPADFADFAAAYEKREKVHRSLLDAVSLSKAALFAPENSRVLDYLKGRGYDESLIRALGFGCLSKSVRELLSGLLPKGVPMYGEFALIPYYSAGHLYGCAFRNIQPGAAPKYLDAFVDEDSTKAAHLFNLPAAVESGTLIAVEGEIDALRAQNAGLSNVVALSSKTSPQNALFEAKRHGAERIIFLLDQDGPGKDHSADLERAFTAARKAGLLPLVAEFPAGSEKVDADTYLLTHSGQELQAIVDAAALGVVWQTAKIQQAHLGQDLQEVSHEKAAKVAADLARLYKFGGLLDMERSTLDNNITDFSGGLLTPQLLQEQFYKVERERQQQERQEQAKQLLTDAAAGGPIDIKAVQQKLSELEQKTAQAEFGHLFEPVTDEAFAGLLKRQSQGVPTGYYFESVKFEKGATGEEVPKQTSCEELTLSAGALTYICAPTSQGKSRFLQNLALSVCDNDNAIGGVLYLSLEESRQDVITRLVNIKTGGPLNAGRNNAKTLRQYYSGQDYVSNEGRPLLEGAERAVKDHLTSGRLRVISATEQPGLSSIDTLCGVIKCATQRGPLQAVFVDYAQLLYLRGAKGMGRKDELTEICRRLMALSIDTRLPIVLAAQLNREAVSPLDMAAQNIADASNIEMSADTIVMLWDGLTRPTPGKDNNYTYKTTTGSGDNKAQVTKPTQEAKRLKARGFDCYGFDGFNPRESPRIYAFLAKNRNGERNLSAIFDCVPLTGEVKKNESIAGRQERLQAAKDYVKSLFANN